MIRFYNRYFLSTAQITLPGYSKEDNIKIYVNKKAFDPISSTIKGDTISYVIPNIPRHVNSWAQIITSDKVSEKHYFQGEDFYLDRLHRKINWETHIDNKRKAMFTLRDKYLTSEIVLLNMKGDTLKDLDPEIRPISFKKIGLKINRTKKGTYKIVSNTEGRYPFVIKNENYPTQWPQTIEFSDSSTYAWKYKGLKNRSLINMQLSKKSLPITWSLNTLLPGAGMFYQNERDSYKAWIASVNLVSYLIFLNSSITNYNDFKSSRTNYLYYQNQFMQNSFLSDKNKTLYYYRKSKDYKKEFQINLLLTLTINILSNLYLHEGFLREKKFRNWFK